jgi:uncharacterized YceG family protein
VDPPRVRLGFLLLVLATVVVAGCGGGQAATTTSAGPRPKVLRIVFPEGFTRAQMADRVGAVRAIARVKRGVTMRMTPRAYLTASAVVEPPVGFRRDSHAQIEGFLFPATYAFFSDERSSRFVRRQLRAFRLAWKHVDMRYARSKNLTSYDVLIIASMIEREVIVPRERRLVAAVVYNRLHAGMPLGIDATLRYGLNIPPTEPITNDDLASDSAFNTRNHTGLPPTPIANPGVAAMQAAAYPAKVRYLYFVRKPDCRSHFFTASESAFLAYTRKGLECSRGSSG